MQRWCARLSCSVGPEEHRAAQGRAETAPHAQAWSLGIGQARISANVPLLRIVGRGVLDHVGPLP
jgi:hypothetical protein